MSQLFGGSAPTGTAGRNVIRDRLAAEDLLYRVGYGVNVAAAICGEADRCALHALAQSAVLVNAHAADRRLGL